MKTPIYQIHVEGIGLFVEFDGVELETARTFLRAIATWEFPGKRASLFIATFSGVEFHVHMKLENGGILHTFI